MLLSLLYMALRVILCLASQGEARDRDVEILVKGAIVRSTL